MAKAISQLRKGEAGALADLPSLGPTSARMLAETGVTDFATLSALGPIACFRSLRFRYGKRVTLNFLYAMECAIRGLDWRLLEPERKAELRAAARGVIAELELSRTRRSARPPIIPAAAEKRSRRLR
jgi:DNA transformation protein